MEQAVLQHERDCALEFQGFIPFRPFTFYEMLYFGAVTLHNLVALISTFTQLDKPSVEGVIFQQMPSDDVIVQLLAEAQDVCSRLGLKSSEQQIKRILKKSLSGKVPINKAVADFTDLQSRLRDELMGIFLIAIPEHNMKTYHVKQPFGSAIEDNFPSAAFDIKESARCFAFRRFTACVMHLQRVLEIGLKAFGGLLAIPSLLSNSQPNWNKILDQTRKEIKERNDKTIPTKSWVSDKEKDFCEDVQPFLEAVKIAWRNPSMHADAKYTEEEAEDVYGAVKRFMKHLAEHLDEQGIFTP